MQSIFQVITLVWSLQGGQYLSENILAGDTFSEANPYYLQGDFEFQIPLSWTKGDNDNVFIGLSFENQFFPDKRFGFDPWQDSYRFGAGLRLLGVEVGYEHECVHPVVVNNIPMSRYFGSYDKVYLKVGGGI